jgi:APA family basic amino acid/polyamine antiporter
LIVVFGISSNQANIQRIFDLTSSNGSRITFSAMFTAMLAAFWAYQGWAAIGFVGGEIKNPKKDVPLGITAGIFIIIALYLLVNATYLSLLPITTVEDINASRDKVAAIEATRVFWGSGGVLLISCLIAITTLGCTNATILTSCRIYYAMAREGLFFSKVSRLNRAHVPVNALLYQGVWACVLVLSGTFDQLTDMIIFAVFIYYGATALGVFILRKKMPNAPRTYKVWAYPLVPAVVVVFSGVLFINTIFSRPREAAIGMILMLTGIPMYFLFRKLSSRPTSSSKVT